MYTIAPLILVQPVHHCTDDHCNCTNAYTVDHCTNAYTIVPLILVQTRTPLYRWSLYKPLILVQRVCHCTVDTATLVRFFFYSWSLQTKYTISSQILTKDLHHFKADPYKMGSPFSRLILTKWVHHFQGWSLQNQIPYRMGTFPRLILTKWVHHFKADPYKTRSLQNGYIFKADPYKTRSLQNGYTTISRLIRTNWVHHFKPDPYKMGTPFQARSLQNGYTIAGLSLPQRSHLGRAVLFLAPPTNPESTNSASGGAVLVNWPVYI